MSLCKLTKTLDFIRSLPDKPRLEDGYTPEVLKARFDAAAEEIRTYLNDSLLPELESENGASFIGSDALSTIEKGSVYTQLCALEEKLLVLSSQLKDAAMGMIPPESISFAHLSEECQELIRAATERTFGLYSFTAPGTYTFVPEKSGTYRLRMCGGGAPGTYYNPLHLDSSLPLMDLYPGHGGASGASLETFVDLVAGEACTVTVGAGGAAPKTFSSVEGKLPLPDTNTQTLASYITDNDWILAGEASSFQSAGGTFVSEGGKNGSRSVSSFPADHNYPVLTQNGTESTDARNEQSSTGASSSLGQGGVFRFEQACTLPGYGGGGHGGNYATGHGIHFHDTFPSDGGCGAVLFEYIR